MTRALLEQALEAMRGPVYGGPVFSEEIRSVMKAIDKHLAQPQGEPVAAAGEDLAMCSATRGPWVPGAGSM